MNFPYITTFMAYEMLSAKKRGIPIMILPIKRHSISAVQSVYEELKECIHYPPIMSVKVIVAFTYFLIKCPLLLYAFGGCGGNP